MGAAILVAGLDGRSLRLEAPVLNRDRHDVREQPSARALLTSLAGTEAPLVVLGPRLPDLDLVETLTRIRRDTATRRVSILVLLPAGEPEAAGAQALAAGANAVLRRPLDPARLESWVSKLLHVPRRVQARVPVQGHVVGSARPAGSGHFLGLTRDLSVHGMLLASPVRLELGPDLDLSLILPDPTLRLTLLGRAVREAAEVGWPHLGYGVEFVSVPHGHRDAIAEVVSRGPGSADPDPAGPGEIHSTIRREVWVYELMAPASHAGIWQVEIRRAPRDRWRAGAAGPYYVVDGGSPDEALRRARGFVKRHG